MTREVTTADAAADIAQLERALRDARAAFEQAESRAASVESVRWIAGEPIRIRFAGSALPDHLLPALEHHAVAAPGTTPVLTVHAWDEASTGAPVPALHADATASAPARSIVGRSRAVSSSPRRRVFEGLDRVAGDAWFAVGSPSTLTHAERGAPFRLVFHWWNAPRGRVLAHAGAVGVGGRGVLLVGPGGAGKSSTALACAEAGFEYSADDYCLVASDPAPAAFGLYATGKVAPADLGFYPGLRPTAGRLRHVDDDKVLLVVSRARPQRIAATLPLCAIAVPAVSGDRQRTTAVPTSPSRALQALAPSTVGQLAGGAASTLRVLAELARALPCYRLELGSDRDAVPPAVAQLIAEASGR